MTTNDGNGSLSFRLDRPDLGLFLPALTWCELTDFSDDAVCLALASTRYDEHDYYRDFDAFRRAVLASSR